MWGHQTSECYKKRNTSFRKVTNMQGPKKLWIPNILLLFDAGMSIPQQEEKAMVLEQWLL